MTKRAYQNVFERLGGEDRLLEEAEKDPKWFYEKIHSKVLQPEKIEISKDKTVAELLAELDEKMDNVTPEPLEGRAIEVQFEEKERGSD